MTDEGTQALSTILERIFEDGKVEPSERAALARFREAGWLDDARMRDVFVEFLEERWREALADGVLSEDEQQLVRMIIEELDIQGEEIPSQIRVVLDV